MAKCLSKIWKENYITANSLLLQASCSTHYSLTHLLKYILLSIAIIVRILAGICGVHCIAPAFYKTQHGSILITYPPKCTTHALAHTYLYIYLLNLQQPGTVSFNNNNTHCVTELCIVLWTNFPVDSLCDVFYFGPHQSVKCRYTSILNQPVES